jgi:hypothetical protein
MLAREHAKATLKRHGWSYRKAAPFLGVGYVHLSRVLNGQRESRRLLAAIAALPHAPAPKGAK